jgi:hypothetical protein
MRDGDPCPECGTRVWLADPGSPAKRTLGRFGILQVLLENVTGLMNRHAEEVARQRTGLYDVRCSNCGEELVIRR